MQHVPTITAEVMNKNIYKISLVGVKSFQTLLSK